MSDMEKIAADVETLKEARIRHDERIKAGEAGQAKAMEQISRLDGEINEKFEMLLKEMREGFHKVHERIDEIEGTKRDQMGYERGVIEARKAMMKQFGTWIAIAGLGISFLAWWFTK